MTTRPGTKYTDSLYIIISSIFLAFNIAVILFVVVITAYRYRNNTRVANGDLAPLRTKLYLLLKPFVVLAYLIAIAIPTLFLTWNIGTDNDMWALGLCAGATGWLGLCIIPGEIYVLMKKNTISLPEERLVMSSSEKKTLERNLAVMREQLGDPKFGDSFAVAGAAETGTMIVGGPGQGKRRLSEPPSGGRFSFAAKCFGRLLFEEISSAVYLFITLPFFIVIITRHT